MTTDHETLARYFDVALMDVPMIAPAFPTESPFSVLDVPAAVATFRARGLSDDTARVALRALFRDELRQRPHIDHRSLEAITSRFDRSLGRFLVNARRVPACI